MEELLTKVDRWLAENRESLIQDLISLVQVESVCKPDTDDLPFGKGCAKAVDEALAIAHRMGLETENHDYFSCSARLPGQKQEEFGLVTHLDVVPGGDFGRFAPFEGIYENGIVIGRGSCDNKGGVVTCLYVAKCLKDLRIPMSHSIRVLMGCSEEIGCKDDIEAFLSKHPAPVFSLVCDSMFPYHHGEKGILTADIVVSAGENMVDFTGGIASNSVPDKASIVLKDYNIAMCRYALPDLEVTGTAEGFVKISAEGIAGHAAFPQGSESAVAKLVQMLAASGLLKEKDLPPIQMLAQGFVDFYGTGLGINHEDEIFGKNTCVGGTMRMKEGMLVQNINIRYSPTSPAEKIVEKLNAFCQQHQAKLMHVKDDPPVYIPADHPVLQILLAVSREQLDRPDLTPMIMAGGTHMRRLPNAVGFGCSLADEVLPYGRPHGKEECVRIDSLLRSIKVYIVSLLEMDKWFHSHPGKI